VKEQLAAVTQKWDGLTGQLGDRCDWIDQAIVKSTQYQSLLRNLSDRLRELDNKLTSNLAMGTLPGAMNQQLETAQKLQREVEQETKQINAAQALCEDLSALVKEEYLKAELSRQLEGVVKSFKDIEQKAGLSIFSLHVYFLVRSRHHMLLFPIIQDPKETLPH
jgi:dystonin